MRLKNVVKFVSQLIPHILFHLTFTASFSIISFPYFPVVSLHNHFVAFPSLHIYLIPCPLYSFLPFLCAGRVFLLTRLLSLSMLLTFCRKKVLLQAAF